MECGIHTSGKCIRTIWTSAAATTSAEAAAAAISIFLTDWTVQSKLIKRNGKALKTKAATLLSPFFFCFCSYSIWFYSFSVSLSSFSGNSWLQAGCLAIFFVRCINSFIRSVIRLLFLFWWSSAWNDTLRSSIQ